MNQGSASAVPVIVGLVADWSAGNRLILCGIATDACVLKTALDAFERGYVPWVVRDAVASNAT
ncbi:isochorismatase family protein [Nocardia brasiliensis]|uniref:isochorismatase family protein n=1 Tax=Nocardia brasiliensis TaxID=37326 RepID=UPI002455D0A6|nr:isochorismatase family protein [Nocardia brasiliensis]